KRPSRARTSCRKNTDDWQSALYQGRPMTIDQLMNVLVTIMLIVMMVAIGIGVSVAEFTNVSRNWRLVFQAFLANYICIPAITVGLLLAFHPPDPMVPAGFLILAACPGAPFAPSCTAIAKGNVAPSVGIMVPLAGSSVVLAPFLLGLLLP